MTRLLVLGLLNTQPMSGYDIKQMLETIDAKRWADVLIGSIYHALKKLEQEQYIKISSIENTGNRQKAIYTITDLGKEHLQKLIANGLNTSSIIYPSKLYSALAFSENLSKDKCIEELKKQKLVIENEYKEVQKGLEEKSIALENKIPPMTLLIMDNMFSIIKQQESFIENALKLLESE